MSEWIRKNWARVSGSNGIEKKDRAKEDEALPWQPHYGDHIADPNPNPEEALIAAHEQKQDNEETLEAESDVPFELRLKTALEEKPFPSAATVAAELDRWEQQHGPMRGPEPAVVDDAEEAAIRQADAEAAAKLATKDAKQDKKTVRNNADTHGGRGRKPAKQKGAPTVRKMPVEEHAPYNPLQDLDEAA